MRKVKNVLLLLVLSATYGFAQTTVPNVLNLRSAKSSGTIIEENKIVGYYLFYVKEKVDKKNTAYEIDLFDDNYNSTGKFEIVRPKKTLMLEMVYNGSCFMIQFYDNKTGIEFITYDRTGKKLGSNIVAKKEISKWELARISNNLNTASENITIFPAGDEGFIRNTYVKNEKIGYEIMCYNNSSKVDWTYKTDVNSKLVEVAEIIDVAENVMTATVTKKKNQMTKEMDMFCLILNTKTGKKIKEFQLGTEAKGRKSILKSFVNEREQKIIIVGEYFKPNDDYLKDKSQGLFIMELDMEGNEVSSKQFAWKGDIDKFKNTNLDEEDKKEADKPFGIFFHDVIVAKNGHVFLIGEQFRKQVSAAGVASKVAATALGGSSDAGAFEVRIANMIVIELDENKNMIDFDIVNKRKTSINIPGGAMMSTAYLGYYVKSLGGFDYSFTSRNDEKDEFDVIYTDYNRKEEKGQTKRADLMLGVISVREGDDASVRIPVNCESKFWWIQAAKPGYIAVGEYFRKEKRIDFRLESLSK